MTSIVIAIIECLDQKIEVDNAHVFDNSKGDFSTHLISKPVDLTIFFISSSVTESVAWIIARLDS